MSGGGDAEIFRKEARERLARPEGIDLSLGLSQMRYWITIFSLLLLGAAALLLLYILLNEV